MEPVKLYLKYISLSIKSQLSYKVSFILLSMGNFAITVIEFIGVLALFDRFESIKGYSVHEIAIFYGAINCSFALAEAFGRGFDQFHKYIQSGNFDRILLRPRGVIFQILSQEIQIMRIGRLMQGIFVLFWGFIQIGREVDFLLVSLVLLSIIGGIAVFTGLFVLQATLSIFTIESLEIVNAFTYGGVQSAQYPISIYKKWFQYFFIYIIPLACVSYFPLNGALKNENLVLAFLAPFMGLVFFIFSLLIFKIGSRFYSSTGT